jgi:hypothetical protein
MTRKLFETPFPPPDDQGVIEVELPEDTTVLSLDARISQTKVQLAGPPGQPPPMSVTPVLVFTADIESDPKKFRFALIAPGQDVPDYAVYVDMLSLPGGQAIHLFKLRACDTCKKIENP